MSWWLGRVVVCDLLLVCLVEFRCRWSGLQGLGRLDVSGLRLVVLVGVEGWVGRQMDGVDRGKVGVGSVGGVRPGF